MKRIIILLFCAILIGSLFSCGSDNSGNGESSEEYEIALICDVGSIEDKSFNRGTWEGITNYAEKNNKSYKYFEPVEDSDDARLEQIDLAVEKGAKIIVTPGSLFCQVIATAQAKYPDVHFILIDGVPIDDKGKEKIGKNTVGITFAEEQSGYLAGYSVVKDGNSKIAFVGGMELPAVVRYGYGFLQGANDAAKEEKEMVTVHYKYTGEFIATPELKSEVSKWYQSGTQVVFSCGGEIFESISEAAEEQGGLVVGADVDQSKNSQAVITSATKALSSTVQDLLSAYYDDKFPGGKHLKLGAKVKAIGLPMDHSRFKSFSQKDYDSIFNKIKNEDVKIADDEGIFDAFELQKKEHLRNLKIKIGE